MQIKDLILERKRQDDKWGEQNHDPCVWMTILTEEVGEVAKEALRMRFALGDLALYRAEAIQVAAVALAMVECIDRGTWKWPE